MAKAMLRAALALGFALLLAAPALQGCGGKSPDEIVATVNGESLTLGYLEAKWAKLADNDPDFMPTPETIDSLRHEVLRVIINKELIVDQARQQNYTDDEAYRNSYEGQANYRLIELLKNKEIVDRLPEFTEEDFQEHYQYIGLRVRARHVDVDTEAEARDLRERITSGDLNFHDAVLQYSTNQDRFSGGELSWVSFGQNIKPVEEALFHMEVEEVSQPIQTPYGWSLFIVDEIQREEPEEYAAVRAGIKKRLEMRALRELGAQHSERVLKKHGFKFHWDAAQVILDHMPDDPTPSQVREMRTRTEEKPVLKLNEEELAMTLYELDGEEYDLQAFSDEYDRLHPFARPMKSARLQGIYNFIHKQVIGETMPVEAIEQGLDKDPEFILTMKEFEEQSCIGIVKAQLVDKPIEVSEDEAKTFYEENPRYYTVPEQIQCKQIVVAEEEQIREAWRRLQEGETFDAVGEDLSITWGNKWLTDFFTPDTTRSPDNVAFREVLKLDEFGEYTDPFNFQGYWGILQLTDRKAEHVLDWDEVGDKVMRDVKELRSNERLDSLLAIWWEDADITINERVLAKAEKGPAPNPDRERF